MKRSTLQNNSPPRGFTMVELLIVMGIIAFLVTISVMVVSGAIGTARDKKTRATIRKIDGNLTQRTQAFDMAMKAQKIGTTSRGDVLKRKQLFRSAFPQTLPNAGTNASAEALYDLITNQASFGADTLDSDSFDSSEVGDTDGDGRKEFLDGWGNPIRFYRWPTRLIRPAPAGREADPQQFDNDRTMPPDYDFLVNTDYGSGTSASLLFAALPMGAELAKDPGDPLGLLNPSNINVPDFEANYHTPETWSVPLIISAGADGVLGIYEPEDTANFGQLAQPITSDPTQLEGMLDNISNRKL